MRLPDVFLILLLFFLMVSCGAQNCSWERATNSRGLNQHRASCKFFKKSSVLASQKRLQRARDAATLGALPVRAAGTRNVKAHRIAPCQSLRARPKPSITPTSIDSSASGSHLPLNLNDLDSEKGENDLDVTMGFEGLDVLDHDAFHYSTDSQEPALSSRRRVPRRFHDTDSDLAEDVVPLPPPPSRIRRVLLTLKDTLQTAFNSFGLCRLYPRRPSFEPNKFVPSSLLSRSCPTITPGPESAAKLLPPPYPYPNHTIYRLMTWMNSGSLRKSETEVQRLVKEVLQAADFDVNHLEGFSVRKSLRELDRDEGSEKIAFPDDWIETSVTIDIPTKSSEEGPTTYAIPGLHYRPLVEVIRAAFADIQAGAFHIMPFKRLWKDPLDDHEERIFDELYSSDAWLEAQDDLQRLPKEPNCSLERVIAGLMFFSDATHLANFGTAKAWPLYLYFGNLTKYARSLPQSGACHLVGFLPSLPDSIKDVLSGLSGISKTGMSSLHTHCRRELFQGCWEILLDEDFLRAYRHGIVLRCADGMLRRVFPRIFTYSADYPEKVLIAAIKDMGTCACPRCFTPKAMFSFLGTLTDMRNRIKNLREYAMMNVVKAREFIYQSGNTVDGSKVERTLGDGSWVPTINQFVKKLGPLGLDPFQMLVVDFMHECELGTWKALLTHLVRLIYALPGGGQLVATLDSRFRQVPTFGNGVIRKFANNTSEMKRLAARDFEDILQCAIPVFEGLFPTGHDAVVQSLLYRFAQWHALAKLRLHTESTVTFLEETFNILSRKLRKFRDATCAAFTTVELPKERAARQRKLAQRSESNTAPPGSSGARVKRFNLNTYKFHAMGDYVRTIRLFGSTDSFTSQMGELAHRALKAFYPLTSKLDTPAQLAKHERRRRVLRRVAEVGGASLSDSHSPTDTPPSSSGKHHHIATNQGNPVNMYAFLRQHSNDPAVKNFVPKLKDHVLYRLRKLDIDHCDHTFTDEEHNSVIIPNNTIYSVQTMQVHYTTYDLRREYDTVSPRTHADIMVLSGEVAPSHPYWYARLLGIYHVETWLNVDGGQPVKQHLEFLWVRWLAPLRNHRSGIKHARLPKVAFVEESDPDAFGFLDPGQVVRGVHLIPAFASGRGTSSLRYGPSLARPEGDLDDWEEHYVGIFVDRDMFMRYTHFGVGHPVMVRRLTRDCLGYESVTPVDAMDAVNEVDDTDDVEVEGREAYHDGQADDNESEDEDEEDGEDDEDEEDGEDEEDEGEDEGEDDMFDDLSF
ncbi:hypothetical protein CY34DRAFT_813946 [Suillus luteus UH-Slu-Lm8-n1]|uniref:Uncharacterized protein n=1 Tax=Suillus luteus UH-Slu-Lm8-n1 TaxID=930992 RepID=A0A0C9ZUC1_9AGAM|nr:hypothetical protein CY34DRAFT_813946 [Suillus luteus UH-Slu-Lm8-n1]